MSTHGENTPCSMSLRPQAEATGSAKPSVRSQAQAAVLTAFIQGRLQRYARTGFKRLPSEQLEGALDLLLPPGS